jgi:hypothetical protein
MRLPGNRRGVRPALAGLTYGFVAAVFASTLAAGCDHPFRPFAENEHAIFSMFGYLDLTADTQWVRVMPVRQNLFLEPAPIDAVVTLEHLGSGRVVTLNDSLFSFRDPRLDGVAYAYNFWTTERLEPEASYRLRAVRSDGASTTAHVVMPPYPEISLLNYPQVQDYALLRVRAERVLFVDVYFAMRTASGDPAPPIKVRDYFTFPTAEPGTHGITVNRLARFDRPLDVRRQEIRLVTGRPEWPFHAELPDLAVALPDIVPSNVENGLGFVGGLAIRTIPFHLCEEIAPRADREQSCDVHFSAQSASIAGRVTREPCGDPLVLADIRLTERFADGGSIVRTWKTGWDGSYRFEGIEPGADLVLELRPGTPAVHLPRLGPGERFSVSGISVQGDC